MGKADSESYVIGGILVLVAAFGVFALFGFLSLNGNIVGQATELPTSVDYGGTTYDVMTYAEGESFTFAGVTVHVDWIGDVRVSFSAAGDTVLLRIGDTVPWTGFTLTLMQKNTTHVGILLAEDADVCSGVRDEQTLLCRGVSGCCGSTCVQLPECLGEPDGPIYTCGVREMYCCNEELTFFSDCAEAPLEVDFLTVTEDTLDSQESSVLNQFASFIDALVAQKQSEGPYPTPLSHSAYFDDVDGTNLHDNVTFVFYDYRVFVIVGSALTPEQAIFGTDISQLQVSVSIGGQDPITIVPFLISSDDVPDSNLTKLFDGLSCTTAADCPTLDCVQSPCPEYACTGGLCVLPTGGGASS